MRISKQFLKADKSFERNEHPLQTGSLVHRRRAEIRFLSVTAVNADVAELNATLLGDFMHYFTMTQLLIATTLGLTPTGTFTLLISCPCGRKNDKLRLSHGVRLD